MGSNHKDTGQNEKAVAGEQKGNGDKRGFRVFGGLRDSLANRRQAPDVASALRSAITTGEAEPLKEAITLFQGLDAKRKLGVLLDVESSLKVASSFTFESDEKVRTVITLARFIAGVSDALEPSEDQKIKDVRSGLIKYLKEQAECNDTFNRSHDQVAGVRLAAVSALNAIDYGNFDFWEEQALDTYTRDYVVKELLDMPETENFEQHGWFLLKKNLQELGPAIGRSESANKLPFLAMMLVDSEVPVVKSALVAALFLKPVPQEVLDAAKQLSKLEALKETASAVATAGDYLNMLNSETEKRFFAARQLTGMYASGMAILKPLLEEAGKDFLKSARLSKDLKSLQLNLDAFLHITMAGVYPPEGLMQLLSPLIGVKDAGMVLYNVTGAILIHSKDDKLRKAAAQLESARIRLVMPDLNCADERQFEAAYELIGLYRAGRVQLMNVIAELATDMVDVKFNPPGDTDEQKKAMSQKADAVIEEIRKSGFDIKIEIKKLDEAPQEGGVPEEAGKPKDAPEAGAPVEGGMREDTTTIERGAESGTPPESDVPDGGGAA